MNKSTANNVTVKIRLRGFMIAFTINLLMKHHKVWKYVMYYSIHFKIKIHLFCSYNIPLKKTNVTLLQHSIENKRWNAIKREVKLESYKITTFYFSVENWRRSNWQLSNIGWRIICIHEVHFFNKKRSINKAYKNSCCHKRLSKY